MLSQGNDNPSTEGTTYFTAKEKTWEKTKTFLSVGKLKYNEIVVCICKGKIIDVDINDCNFSCFNINNLYIVFILEKIIVLHVFVKVK